jgi:hypothetical protein
MKTRVTLMAIAAGLMGAATLSGPAHAADDVGDCLQPLTFGMHMRDIRGQIDACRRAEAAILNAKASPGAGVTGAAAPPVLSLNALAAAEKAKDAQMPASCIHGSDDCLTIGAFFGLLRVAFGNKKEGTTETLAPLSGLGIGFKLRRVYVSSDQTTHELLGVNLGLYYEPKVAVVGTPGGVVDSAQTLSATLILSAFENLYVGGGWKFASSEPSYNHGFKESNVVLVLGIGTDGASLLK